jgi:hypothetical protein
MLRYTNVYGHDNRFGDHQDRVSRPVPWTCSNEQRFSELAYAYIMRDRLLFVCNVNVFAIGRDEEQAGCVGDSLRSDRITSILPMRDGVTSIAIAYV